MNYSGIRGFVKINKKKTAQNKSKNKEKNGRHNITHTKPRKCPYVTAHEAFDYKFQSRYNTKRKCKHVHMSKHKLGEIIVFNPKLITTVRRVFIVSHKLINIYFYRPGRNPFGFRTDMFHYW